MAANPVTLDFSKAQPLQTQPQSSGGVTLDFSKAQPISESQPSQQAPQQGTSYQSVPQEATAVGHAAAVEQRQAQHPLLTAVGEGSGEVLGDVWGTVKSMVTHPVDTAGGMVGAGAQAYEHITESVPILHAYEDARAQGKGVLDSLRAANEKAKQQSDAHDVIKQRIDEFKKKPGQASVRALGEAALLAATIYDGGKLNPANLESSARPPITHTFSEAEGLKPVAAEPGIIKQLIKGKEIAQPGTQAAIREGVQASAEASGTANDAMAANIENQPILKGNETIVDKHLSAIQDQEKAAYGKMDETAGFDVKAEKSQLANDQYKLKQLGNTDADVTQRGNLFESINDSENRIAAAEAKMKEAGIDPKAADTIHQRRMAGNDFKKMLVKNTSGDGESVNVDALLNDSKKLRFSKYGDRLEQFFGSKEAADKYMADLVQAQKVGAHAVKARWLAGILGGLALGSGTVAKIAKVGAALVP